VDSSSAEEDEERARQVVEKYGLEVDGPTYIAITMLQYWCSQVS